MLGRAPGVNPDRYGPGTDEGGRVLRRLWDQHGDRLRHWLAVVLTIVVVLTYMEWRDTEADWTVFVLAVGLLLVFEFLLSGVWLPRGGRRSRRRDEPPDGGPLHRGPHT
jgi:hypothetical protein